MEGDQQVSEEVLHTLRRDYTDAADQFAAMNDVLIALGRSASDPDAVFKTIVETVRRLCRCEAAAIMLIEGGQFVLSSSVGFSREYVRHVGEHPFKLDRASLIGRVITDRTIQQIPDVLTDPEYGRQDVQRIVQFRTVMAAPMLLDGEVVGALSLVRTRVDPFDDRTFSLVGAFAAQAAVVVRNVHLVRELEERSLELGRKVEQLEALSEVGGVVSSSLVLDEVLSNIIMNAVRFSGCDGGSIMEYVSEEQCFSVRSAYASSPELLAKLRRVRVDLHTTLVGRTAVEGHPIAVADLDEVELDPHLRLLREDGWLSVLAVPVMRGERIIGALVVRRKTRGEFSNDTIEFLETFASQSALAVWNAQLFRELETKSAELQVASQHKSEFLASMSHELRTPLNAVIGFSEVLLEGMFGDLNERQEEYLRDILSSGKHLLQLLNDILDLSKVEAGRMELEWSTFSLRGALEYGISMVRDRAAAHGIDLTLEIGTGIDTLDSDELRFKQVLLNLLSNAVKFTGDGGRVAVVARRRGEDDKTPADAEQLGISTIYQEFNLTPNMTIAENIFLGHLPTKAGRVDWATVRQRSRELLDSLDVSLPVDTLTGSLSVAKQQMVEIAKALNRNTKILVMDEPSAVLGERDIENLFSVVRRLQATGIGIVYISHRLKEIFELADEVTVLKDGRYIDTLPVAGVTMDELVKLMIGRDLEDVYPKRRGEPGEVVLEVSHLAQTHLAMDVSFQLRAGEIIGFAGITGSGRTEVARVIFGADRATSGEMTLLGKPYRPRSPRDAINQGVALVSEDRKREGLLLKLQVYFNTTVSGLDRLTSFGVLRLKD